MKPVKRNEFKLTSSIARSIAEANWGRGGTSSYKTNRKGVYYYSCAGHGGYIVDAAALTNEERAQIDKWITPNTFDILVQKQNDEDVVIGWSNPYSVKRRRFKYCGKCPEWQTYEYYEFEEDCAWSILAYFTDVCLLEDRYEGYDYKDAAKRTFESWYLNRAD